jgi:hypothetical protein
LKGECNVSAWKKTFILALTSFIGTVAHGSPGFTCGGDLIMPGDSKAHVEKHCGSPSSISGGDTWIYERGPEQFTVTIHFEADGTVNRITKE